MNFFVIFGIIFLAYLTSILLSMRIIKRLKNLHPVVWEEMGKPKMIKVGQRIGGPEGKHFWIDGYKDLGDKDLENQIELLRMFNNVYGVITVVFIVLMVGKLILSLG